MQARRRGFPPPKPGRARAGGRRKGERRSASAWRHEPEVSRFRAPPSSAFRALSRTWRAISSICSGPAGDAGGPALSRPISSPRARSAALVERMAALPFRPFEFQGFLGKRETVSFGWSYRFDGSGLRRGGADPRVAAAGPRRGRRRSPGSRRGARACVADPIWRRRRARLASGPAGVRRRDRHLAARRRRRCAFGRKAGREVGALHADRPSRARSTCCAARRGANGSTASRRSRRCVIR